MTAQRIIEYVKRVASVVACLLLLWCSGARSESHVMIVVIDGGRYTETFGAKDRNMPVIWNVLRPQGTIFTNMRNEGKTLTCPGHASILTGVWQYIPNNGSERPHNATLFEYLRKETSAPAQSCYVISGKEKLDVLTYGTDPQYGKPYGASFLFGDTSDVETYTKVSTTISRDHPRMTIVNLPEVDLRGHAKDWNGYLYALHRADSLVGLLWTQIQSDSIMRNTTTLFVTNDHGRHDEQHGGFQNHGDTCEGCRHIMLLALGPDFPAGNVVTDTTTQVDLAPTSAQILGILMPPTQGKNILRKEVHSAK
ncbi:MAG TPA: alkaline phosphatase family protein [Bacteroidota bacterium]|nr:alkaline phosphatase family protein [Bacteroidota bacterium]